MAPQKKDLKKKAKAPVKFTIDCSAPAGDGIFDVAAFEKFLHDRIKVSGRTNNLGEAVAISKASAKSAEVAITIKDVQFAKRYLKYLTKKFLKKNSLRDYMRVVAKGKTGYELKYFKLDEDAEEEADE
ncbi:hypothetical protein SmJEL517_g02499 [Synchytrium microbalum]|uniref:Large ribosomal subunit protein eL22 n=1 Tax=Synchytrium microbalum TaxID=1806994 RepID=A0A507CAG4_9FUNG|nr:uncharacterized protein SmJEL517_g02499 [Synchytrium microbalum]TPX34996.1 hypothetical protein SmJEL517_g02499 [Synchytrium microbalum]